MLRIAITPPYFYPGEAEAIAGALERGGFDRVHIRKLEADDSRLLALLESVAPHLRQRVTLHDGHPHASRLGYGGIHLSGRNPHRPQGWEGMVLSLIHI